MTGKKKKREESRLLANIHIKITGEMDGDEDQIKGRGEEDPQDNSGDSMYALSQVVSRDINWV